jgi:hypothetical protein
MVSIAVGLLPSGTTVTTTACVVVTTPTATTAEEHSCDATTDEIYTCSACASTWSYRTVRNTGRCPACGDGLRRSNHPAQ